MLDGRYPSDQLRRAAPADRLGPHRRHDARRKGARQLAVTNAGTIPDRGLYGVHLPDGRRVGELDEEMVYEARPGQTFLLGATTWRIEEITRDRVIVTPAPGVPGAVPFWRATGSAARRAGAAIGAFSRGRSSRSQRHWPARLRPRRARGREPGRLPARAAGRDARASPPTGRSSSSAFRDEIGDWRLCVLSPSAGACTPRGACDLGAHPRAHGPGSLTRISSTRDRLHLPDLDMLPIFASVG